MKLSTLKKITVGLYAVAFFLGYMFGVDYFSRGLGPGVAWALTLFAPPLFIDMFLLDYDIKMDE